MRQASMQSDVTPITVVHLGHMPYLPCWQLQRALAAARRRGDVSDLLLLVEHPPTYTIGKGGSWDNLLLDEQALQRLGAVCVTVDRGGDITFHGPGQLVLYFIMALGPEERRVRRFVERLERVVIETIAAFGITGHIDPAYPGVWVGDAKIAALGIAVHHGVTYHGTALNVDPDLRYFTYMIPCGIRGRGVTSLARELGRSVQFAEVLPPLLSAVEHVFERPVSAGPSRDQFLASWAQLLMNAA